MLVRGKECIRLDSLTPPVGMLPNLPAIHRNVELLTEDWLLIFSDGITEAASESGEDFGDAGLLAALSRFGGATAAEMCEGVVNEVRDYVREQRHADDITLIAVKVVG